MQGDQEVIAYLNKVISNELTAINQYFVHAKMFKNWGFSLLHKVSYDDSIEEMKHADKLIERVLFLEGLPNLQQLHKLRIGENPSEILDCDLALGNESVVLLREAIAYCEQVNDYVSRELLADLLEDEEEHIDWLETQFELIRQTSIETYLAEKM
jgi:bacterioferritin